MPAPRHPNQRAQCQDVMQWLRRLWARIKWDRQDPYKQGPAWVMVSAGLLLITLALVAIVNHSDMLGGLLLLFGCGLVILGCPLLLLALIEWIANQFIYDKKYCGCCVFYHPREDDYAVGLCGAADSETPVKRTHYCPSFRYSERAMVRERLWQQRYTANQIRISHIDDEQTGSDD
ncbi:MAG TPA: hypothetical protein VH590_15375 [Ktedonobacterales bacterium]